MFEKLTKFTDSFLDMGIPGYDCIVMHNGRCVYRHSNGYSDIDSKTPINGKERINIYSCSKPITCVAAMQLWEKGKFSLDDKLSDYMPEFYEMNVKTDNGIRKAEKPILIKHLFEMTAGFSYDTNSESIRKLKADTNGTCPIREAMKYIAKEPLLFEPGERWEYSLCHDVLAAFVEVVSGVKFSRYVKENIFDRVGMKNSTFSLPDDELDTISSQYIFDYKENKPKKIGHEIQFFKFGSMYESGGAGCISSLEDYILFLENLRDGEVLLKRDTIELMIKNRLTEKQGKSYSLWQTHGYGLGLRCPKDNGEFDDFGWGGAAGSYLAVDTKNNITVFYAQHMHSSPNQTIRGDVYKIAKEELV